jgi:hypothetical protein
MIAFVGRGKCFKISRIVALLTWLFSGDVRSAVSKVLDTLKGKEKVED